MTVSSARLIARFQATQVGPNDFGQQFSPTMERILDFTAGVAANQSDLLFVDERTVASATNDDLDLAGVLLSAFGSAITFAELTGLILINAPRLTGVNTTNLTLGGGTNPFIGFLGGTAPTIGPIRPGGFIMLGCGDAAGLGTVVAGTGDILRIANSSGAAATYQIGLLGRSA